MITNTHSWHFCTQLCWIAFLLTSIVSLLSITVFAPPRITNVELVDGVNLYINWTFAGQHVGSYVLEILRYEGNTLTENRTVVVMQNFHIIENANLNSEYRFRVQAVSDTGSSTFTQQRTIQLGVGLRGWHIALIVIFLVLAVLLCCILCCCIVLFWRERRRTYYTEKQGLCIAMSVLMYVSSPISTLYACKSC